MSASLRTALVAVLVLALSPAARVQAWTDVRARGADVVVELDHDGWARVFFDVSLQVRGGWLEGYEISGLDPDAQLDALKPPVLVGEEGQKWSPRARMRDGGRLTLAFDRRSSPRRGSYQLRFGYRTRLIPRASTPAAEGGTEVRWTLPAWRTGLDSARLWLWAPSAQARPARGEQGAEGDDRRTVGARTLLGFHRLHVPRATPWTVGFVLPADSGVAGLAAASPKTSGAWTAWFAERPDWLGGGLSLLLLLVAAHLQGRRAARRHVQLIHPFGSRRGALFAAGLSVAAASVLVGPGQLVALALAVVFSLSLRRGGAQPVQFGTWRKLGAADRRRARLDLACEVLGLRRAPDPLSVPGLLVVVGLAAWSTWGEVGGRPGVIWAAVCFAFACALSSLRWGAGASRLLLSLFRLAGRVRLPGVALSMRAFSPAWGDALQVRLGVVPQRPIGGLVRLEVSARSGLFDGGRFVVLVTVKAASAADVWLAELAGQRLESSGGQRACHLWDAADARQVQRHLEAVLGLCAERAHASIARAA